MWSGFMLMCNLTPPSPIRFREEGGKLPGLRKMFGAIAKSLKEGRLKNTHCKVLTDGHYEEQLTQT